MEARCNGIYFCPKNWMFHIGQCVSHQRDEGRVVCLVFFSPFICFLFFWKSQFSVSPKEATPSNCEFVSNNMTELIFKPSSCWMCGTQSTDVGPDAEPRGVSCASARAWISVCREAPFYKNVCISINAANLYFLHLTHLMCSSCL